MKFPEITENFICLCISQLKDMRHLLDISFMRQKFHMSCIFPEPRKCDIYLTFPESVRNFVCRVYFLSLGNVTFI